MLFYWEKDRQREREGRRGRNREGKEIKTFFSFASWLIPYTAEVRPGEWQGRARVKESAEVLFSLIGCQAVYRGHVHQIGDLLSFILSTNRDWFFTEWVRQWSFRILPHHSSTAVVFMPNLTFIHEVCIYWIPAVWVRHCADTVFSMF